MRSMNRVLSSLFLVAIFCIPNQSRLFAQGSQNQDKLVQQWTNFINVHDTNSIATLYADSAALLSPNWQGTEVGKAAVRKVFRRYFSSTPDFHLDVVRVTHASDAVVVEYNFGGTFSQPEAGTPEYMKGKKYELKACTIMALKKGLIENEVFYFDQVAFLRQVGFFEQLPK